MVQTLLLRPDTHILATVRDPSSPASKSLLELPTGASSSITVLPLDVRTGWDSFKSALASTGITHLNTVISNAGNSDSFVSVMDTKASDLLDDYEVNVVGTFNLFQTCWPYLSKTPEGSVRQFVLITSSVGSIASLAVENMPGVAYGASKAAANWVAKKLSVEYAKEGLHVGIIHPGYVASIRSYSAEDNGLMMMADG